MMTYGFSTGALALGDFQAALGMLEGRGLHGVELSALREHEVRDLVRAIPTLSLSAYGYVSVHAPGRFDAMSEAVAADLLSVCIPRRWPVVVHPDAIRDHGCWRHFGDLLCIENMDKRKTTGRTVRELDAHFRALPDASLCLDLGHARQIDPTLGVAFEILRAHGHRIVQLHLSELDVRCRHQPLSVATVAAVRELAPFVPPAVVILESHVTAEDIDAELAMARACFTQDLRVATRHEAEAALR